MTSKPSKRRSRHRDAPGAAALETAGPIPSARRVASRSSPPRSKAGGAYHHGDLRQGLLDAAYAYVDANNADSLSLAELAKSLGVSQAAPYRHFADRSALLAAVATQGFREFAARLKNATRAGPPGSSLTRMGHAYVDFGTQRPGVYQLMFASPVLRESSSPELSEAASGSFALLVEALPNSRTRERRAVRIWAALHGVVMLLNQGLLKDGDAAVSAHELVEDIVSGR